MPFEDVTTQYSFSDGSNVMEVMRGNFDRLFAAGLVATNERTVEIMFLAFCYGVVYGGQSIEVNAVEKQSQPKMMFEESLSSLIARFVDAFNTQEQKVISR